MKRYPAFDPPEYVRWKPDAAVMRTFERTLRSNPERGKIIRAIKTDLRLYRVLPGA